MRICLVSTYAPQRCGIGTYTRALAHALRETGEAPMVLSEIGALDGEDDGVVSRPIFRRDEDYGPRIEALAVESSADVVHVQHSPDIFGVDRRLPRLLERLRDRGIPTVVTLHTVHTWKSGALERRFDVAGFHRHVARAASALVVHGARAMPDELVRQGVPRARIHVIAHGTRILPPVDRSEALRRLGFDGAAHVVLFFGFIHPQKNVHTVLLAMADLRRRVPGSILYVAGSLQNPGRVNRLYAASLERLVTVLGLEEHVRFRREFVPQEETALLYGAADLVLLPYAQGYGSASGIAHHAVGAGRIPLCSKSPKFEEIGDAIDPSLLVPTHSPRAWARAMSSLLTNDEHRGALEERVRRFASATSWAEAARRHGALYRSLAGSQSAR